MNIFIIKCANLSNHDVRKWTRDTVWDPDRIITSCTIAHIGHSLKLKVRTEPVYGQSCTCVGNNSLSLHTYCMKLLFATPHLVARKSLSNNVVSVRKSITMACKLAKFPQQNCIVQNQFRGPGQRHHVPRRLLKHSAGHPVEALHFCEQWIMSKQWPLHEHKHCLHWWCFVSSVGLIDLK